MVQAWSKNKTIDHDTFGNSKACHVLVYMMNNKVISLSQRHSALSLIHNASAYFKNILSVPDPRIRVGLLEIMYHNFDDKIVAKHYPIKFESHFRNVMKYLFNKQLVKAMGGTV